MVDPDVVVVASGEGPELTLPDAKSVVAADGGLLRARELGLTVDVVVGDLDSVTPEALAAAEAAGARVVRHPQAKDATDLELALDEAVALGASRVLVVASAAGRLDHLLGLLLLLGSERCAGIELDALVGDALVHVVRGERRLAGSPGELLTLVPLGGPAEGVATEGLEYPLAGETLEPGTTRGVSNVFTGGEARVALDTGVLLAIRPDGGPRMRTLATVCCKVVLVVTAVVGLAALAAGCGGSSTPDEVVLVTHDSFAISKGVKAAFEQESGLKLRILQGGDANEMLNRALLTAGDPQGDVIFGVDDSILSRALDGDLLEEYRSPELSALQPDFSAPDSHVTPVDHGEVCLNYDRAWFASHRIAPPRTLADLVRSRYRNLLVVENPATSSPGLAFLLATVATFGDRWQAYWRGLRANGVLAVDGWEEAYTQQFSGAAGSPGKRPIVVSYASSPAAEVIFASKPLSTAPTAAVEDGCYRQVEYAGVLHGARNEKGAKELIDFMLSRALPGGRARLDVRLPRARRVSRCRRRS